MNVRMPLPEGGSFSLGYIFSEHLGALERLIADCRDYYDVLGYCPAAEEASRQLFQSEPEGGLTNKFLIGVFSSVGALIGVVCVYRDVPASGQWVVALMLVHPAHRSRGLGSEIFARFERWAAWSGARHIKLMVAAQNGRGVAFWRRCGFSRLFENHGLVYGDATYTGIVMGKDLADSAGTGIGGLFPIWQCIPAVRFA